MKTKLLKLALFAVASVLSLGASAATEKYNFTGFTHNTTTTGGTDGKGRVNGKDINLLQIGTETFNNRFAVSRVGEADVTKGWVAQNEGGKNGLYTLWNNRYFTILNLNDGDQIKITWSTDGDGTLKFYDAPAIEGKSANDAVESSITYTISTSQASVNVNLFADGSGMNTALYIKSVVIKTQIASETVAIGQGIESYNLEAVAKTNDITAIDPITADGTVYSRFSTQQQNCFQISGSGYGFQVNYNKWFSINNLKAGDKVWIRYTKSDGQTVNFEDASLIGETGTVELASETWYTLAKDADKLKLVNQVNTNGLKANYLEVKIMSIDAAVTAGTLVSSTPLNFTDTPVSAYYASDASEGTVTFTKINKVAAGTPIYIKAASAGTYDIPALEDDADATMGNLLKGSATNTTSLQSTDGTKYYVFGVLDDEAGFYPVSTTGTLTSAAGKAYLELTAAQASLEARSIRMVFDEVTGINTVKENEGNETGDNIWYTLQGARVAKPTHGIYIRNGKKIFIK